VQNKSFKNLVIAFEFETKIKSGLNLIAKVFQVYF